MLMAMDGGGASFAIGGKVLKFAPETVAETIAHFDEIRELLVSALMFAQDDLAGVPAGLDEVSSTARTNLGLSTANLHAALESGRTEMFAVSDTVRDNGRAYGASDGLPTNG